MWNSNFQQSKDNMTGTETLIFSACAKTWTGLWTVDCGLWTVDCGLWTMDCGLWTMDCFLGDTDINSF